MNNLYVLPLINSTQDRINNRINAFRADFLDQDGSLDTANQLIEIITEYLSEFEEDVHLEQAYLKLNEAFYYIEKFQYY